mmetsp:Transcript_4276/g.12324  ORF Transcript_4276/g.12324 Transcript_4276/m.12324 type:complete len:247 (-) Transcript_4276:84-824(-)
MQDGVGIRAWEGLVARHVGSEKAGQGLPTLLHAEDEELPLGHDTAQALQVRGVRGQALSARVLREPRREARHKAAASALCDVPPICDEGVREHRGEDGGPAEVLPIAPVPLLRALADSGDDFRAGISLHQVGDKLRPWQVHDSVYTHLLHELKGWPHLSDILRPEVGCRGLVDGADKVVAATQRHLGVEALGVQGAEAQLLQCLGEGLRGRAREACADDTNATRGVRAGRSACRREPRPGQRQQQQ